MTDKAKEILMICLLAGLPVLVVGLGLATSSASLSESTVACLPIDPVQTPVSVMQTPVSVMQTPVPVMQTPAPAMQTLVGSIRQDPLIAVNQVIPQGLQRLCPPQATAAAFVPSLPEPPSLSKILPFQEAHWQGIEVVPSTANLKRLLKITSDAKGVITDETTWPADSQGFQAGDLITSVGEVPTPTLEDFIQATARVRDRRRTEIQLLRQNKEYSIVLRAMQQRLGTANGETAQTIKAGSRSPHGYLGACTNCHHIGSTGQLAVDQGDLLSRAAPPIRAGQSAPHRNRGECTACHAIVP